MFPVGQMGRTNDHLKEAHPKHLALNLAFGNTYRCAVPPVIRGTKVVRSILAS